jgi:hypothetical protein
MVPDDDPKRRRVPLPHFKCVTCRTRLYDGGRPADLTGDPCPGCGVALEPVSELTELVGFRAITTGDHSAVRGAPSRHGGIVDRLGDLLDRRALQAQARLDAERCGEDGGGALAEAVALPRPETTC